MWSAESLPIARTSGFSESYWLSAMDLIARMHSSSDVPCNRLQLLSVSPRPATEFARGGSAGEGSRQTVVPTRVEEWQLEACGSRSVMRVFDDKLKPDMKIGVTRLIVR